MSKIMSFVSRGKAIASSAAAAAAGGAIAAKNTAASAASTAATSATGAANKVCRRTLHLGLLASSVSCCLLHTTCSLSYSLALCGSVSGALLAPNPYTVCRHMSSCRLQYVLVVARHTWPRIIEFSLREGTQEL